MSHIYLEAGHHLNLDNYFVNPKIPKKIDKEKHSYTYIGSGYLKDKNVRQKFGKILAFAGEIFLILLSLGSLLISKSFRNLVEHTWKSCKNGTQFEASHVFEEMNKSEGKKQQENQLDVHRTKLQQLDGLTFPKELELPEEQFEVQLDLGHFSELPMEMKNEIIKRLDPESLIALAQTNKANDQFIRANFPKQRLAALLMYQALHIWKKTSFQNCKVNDQNREFTWNQINNTYNYLWEHDFNSFVSIMNSFPKEGTKQYEKLLNFWKNDKNEFSALVGGLINFSRINPLAAQHLLVKASHLTKDPHTLLGIVFGIAKSDPKAALVLAEKIDDKKIQQQAKYISALYYLILDPIKGSEIINSLDKDVQANYYKTFNFINDFDKEFYLRLVKLPKEVIHSIVDTIIKKASVPSKENLIKAYTDTQQFDTALEWANHTPPETLKGGEELFNRALINIYVKKAEQEKSSAKSAAILEEALEIANQRFKKNIYKFWSLCQIGNSFYKISREKTKEILQAAQKEVFNNSKNYYQERELEAFEDSLLQLAAEYARFDPKEAKEILDKIKKRSHLKIDTLLVIASQYKKGDPEALKLVDEALSLVNDIPNDFLEHSDAIEGEQKLRALYQIARQYVRLESLAKLNEVYRKAQQVIHKSEIRGNETLLELTLLTKIAFLVRPEESIAIVNQKIKPFDRFLCRMHAFVHLSRLT